METFMKNQQHYLSLILKIFQILISLNYDRYVILYNDENEENITIFPFTSDKYYGNVALILLNKHNKIIKLNLEMYSKKLKM